MPLSGRPRVTSPFGMRFHPIKHVYKLHTGIDFAAPLGTTFKAARDGTVTFAGWSNGYGNRVVISHGTINGDRVSTTYNHMRSLSVHAGQHVQVGQKVGEVGSTGLSTGSHLHYEILVNGRFVDPMRIKLPRGRVLEGPMLANFEQERERLDGIMARKPARVASSGSAVR